ncbi:MAG: hypothetical protein Q9191_000089 [Dirinaria sp. TL-2023a]
MRKFGGLLRRRTSKIVLFISFVSLLQCIIPQAPRGLKKAPTDFSNLTGPTTWSSLYALPKQTFRDWTGSFRRDIDERYFFVRELGSGAEGNVKLYNDTYINRAVAIKAFHSHQRNTLPKQLAQLVQSSLVSSWPVEIPATILLAGSRLEFYDENLFSKHRPLGARLNTVPALDYFLIPTGSLRSSPWEWQLVTPYLGSGSGDGQGTLTDLAEHLNREHRRSVELDGTLRPGLHRLLGSLARLHKKGFACNLSKKKLGNVREIGHSYYQTQQWNLEGQWSNCIYNDVRRAIISYLTLIRRASADREEFDVQFFCGDSPLSTLYWDFVRDPTSAMELHNKLERAKFDVAQKNASYCRDSLSAPLMIRLTGLRKLILAHYMQSVLRWSTHPPRLRFRLNRWGI